MALFSQAVDPCLLSTAFSPLSGVGPACSKAFLSLPAVLPGAPGLGLPPTELELAGK